MIYKPSAWTYVLAGILAGWAGAEIIHKEKSAQTCENFDETVEKNGSLIGRNGDLEYLLDKNNCPISRGFARINPTSYSLTAELEPCVYVLAPDGAIEEAHVDPLNFSCSYVLREIPIINNRNIYSQRSRNIRIR